MKSKKQNKKTHCACLSYILDHYHLTCSACRSPACDPLTGASSRQRRRARHRRAQKQHPPAWFTFPGGRTSLPSVRIYSPPGFGVLCLPETFLCPSTEQKTATAAATLGYSTAWEENILRCLISTVGKAILTKPINP